MWQDTSIAEDPSTFKYPVTSQQGFTTHKTIIKIFVAVKTSHSTHTLVFYGQYLSNNVFYEEK
jgi:hypothetical protein